MADKAAATGKLTRAEAVAEVYRRLRATMDALQVAALLYLLDVGIEEIDVAMKKHGDC
jgi:hypothetical protein